MNEVNNLQNIAQAYSGATVRALGFGSYAQGPNMNMPGVNSMAYRNY